MADFPGLVEVIKQAALDAVDAAKPASVLFGKVVGDDPLKIEIGDDIILEGPQLILTRSVTEYEVELSYESETEDESDHKHGYTDDDTPPGGTTVTTSLQTKSTSHKHTYIGDRVVFTVHNALTTGEEVLLIRMPGGQRFIVVDRLEVES